MSKKGAENRYRFTRLCVDSYEGGVLKGRITNPFYDGCVTFSSTMDFLRKMQDIIEDMDFPGRFRVLEGYTASPVVTDGDEASTPGVLATFSLKILFCCNSSWQGTVGRSPDGTEQPFKSALELLFIIDSALRN